MVFIVPPRNAPEATLGNTLGQGFKQGFLESAKPAIQQQYQRGQIQEALGGLKNLPANASPTDLMSALINATAGIPGAERYVGPLYESLLQQRNRESTANVPLTSGGVSAQGNAPRPQQPNQQPGQIGAEGRAPSSNVDKFFPTNKGPNEAPGNLPQEATGGQIKPVWNGEELLQQSENLNQKWIKAGITNRNLDDALKIKTLENEGNIAHNQRVENERIKRIGEQEAFGQLAEDALVNVYEKATDEQKAVFRKKGENVAGQGKSQADIKRTLAKDAVKFKNDISNAEKGLAAPRIQNLLQRKFMGTEKTTNQAMADAKHQVQPLLNEGLYDTSRNLLADAGFYPEEREKIIFGPVEGQVKKTIDSIPKPKYEKQNKPSELALGGGYMRLPGEGTYSPESKENLKANLRQVWGEKENENVNPVLLRKEYEDKGYDWRIFKDALNDEISEGNIELTDDQMNQYNSYLDQPPLSTLEKILYKLDLRGR